MNERLKTGFSILIGSAWLSNLILGVAWHGYNSYSGNIGLAINAPLMLILGSLFANRRREGDDK